MNVETETFNERFDRWRQCFRGDDGNSITNQVCSMLWDAGSFRIICKGRVLATEDGKMMVSGLLHSLLDRAYFQSLLFAIRRQMDVYTLEHQKGKGVFSLRSLLTDMRANRALLTRANILSARGLPYDWEATTEEEERFVLERERELLAHPPEYHNPMVYVRPDQGRRSHEMHILIDELSDTQESERSPEDTVREEVFNGLLAILGESGDKLEIYVNKFLAHAATPESKGAFEGELTPPLVKEVDDAVKTICRVAQTVSIMLIDGSQWCFLPLPPGGYLEYIDRPLVTKNQVRLLDEELENYRAETQKWAPYGVQEVVGVTENTE